MIKIDAAEFARPIGGRWTLTALNTEQRGLSFAGERDEAGTRVVVWDRNQPTRRVVVPMANVLWYADAAPEAATAEKRR